MTGVLAVVALAALVAAALALAAWLRARRDVAGLRAAAPGARDVAQATREAEDAVFDHLPLAAIRVDGANRVRAANRRARALFPHLRPGEGVLEQFGEHRFAERVAASLASGEPSTFEVRLFADGRRTYRVTVEPVRRDADDGAAVYMYDLTEAVAYQELRSQFVANVSHELRTPLTGLRGLIEALEDPEMDRGTHDRFVARAGAEILRLEALISDILFLSELEATQGLPSDARSDLGRAAAAAVETLAPEAEAHRVTLDNAVLEPVWTPLTERMALTVVRNLMENAVKYAGPGARARVWVEREDGDAPDPADGWVTLTVADDGAGIPERHAPHVFERFYRADPSRSKRLGGTGLGLSIVKHIAERFGGAATAESREGFGTTVRVRLPAAPPPGDPAPPAGTGGRTDR